jgi:hypothetical protein
VRALWFQNLVHLFRSRLLIFIVLFSVVVQYYAVKLVKSATMYVSFSVQGNTGLVRESESYFVAVIASYFAGTFLAGVYGAWIAPYLHRGPRSALTHMLPVSRWAFPAAHALTFAVLLLVQFATLIWALGANVGWEGVLSSEFPWKGMIFCFLLQSLSFYVILFGAASASMMLGSLPTFFLTNLACSALVALRAVVYFSESPIAGQIGSGAQIQGTGSMLNLKWILQKLPPLGELMVDMRWAFEKQQLPTGNLALWAIWLAAFVIWFRWRLSYPQRVKASEG